VIETHVTSSSRRAGANSSKNYTPMATHFST
jgi:hypothetical protein